VVAVPDVTALLRAGLPGELLEIALASGLSGLCPRR